jgi:hypothetical protein
MFSVSRHWTYILASVLSFALLSCECPPPEETQDSLPEPDTDTSANEDTDTNDPTDTAEEEVIDESGEFRGH